MDISRRQIANAIAEILESYDIDDASIGGASWDISAIFQNCVSASIIDASHIRDAWLTLRKHNSTIPDNVLDEMRLVLTESIGSPGTHKMTPAQRREFERGRHAASEDIAADSVSYDIDLSSWYGKGYADMLDEIDF